MAKREPKPKEKLVKKEWSYLKKAVKEYIQFLSQHLQHMDDFIIDPLFNREYIRTLNERELLKQLSEKIEQGAILKDLNATEYFKLVDLVDERYEVIESKTQNLCLESLYEVNKVKRKKIDRQYDKSMEEEFMLITIKSKL